MCFGEQQSAQGPRSLVAPAASPSLPPQAAKCGEAKGWGGSFPPRRTRGARTWRRGCGHSGQQKRVGVLGVGRVETERKVPSLHEELQAGRTEVPEDLLPKTKRYSGVRAEKTVELGCTAHPAPQKS